MIEAKKIFGKLAMVLLPTVLILSLIFMVVKIKERMPEVAPGPGGAQVSPTPGPLSPTRWATDSAVLAIERQLLKIEKDLESVDLSQVKLHPPVLDMEVEF